MPTRPSRNKNFGSAKRLRVRDGSLPARQAFVRFAVSGLAGSVTQATLRFYVTNGTPDGPAVYRTGAWPKKALTWARRPAVTGGPRGDKGQLVPGTWVEWDVTPWVTGNDAYRFALRGGAADTLELASRETNQGIDPQLVVTTSSPPPPDPPSTVVFVAPTQGATVSDVREVRVRAPAGTDWVGVYACGGGSVGEDHLMDANGEWSVQWDTRTAACSNGTQDLDAWAFRDDGSDVGNATITVEVANSSPPPPPDPEPSPCPSAEPGPVEGQGYQLRFSDCFDTFSRSVWCSNQWWEPTPPPGTQYAEDGILHLVRRRSDGYPNVTVSSEPCGQASPKVVPAGLLRGADALDTACRGSGPAFWLLSTAHATNPNWPQPACPQPTCLSAEIDVFEGYGNHLDVFTGTIHRNSCGCYGAPNSDELEQLAAAARHEPLRLARLWGSLDEHERDVVSRWPPASCRPPCTTPPIKRCTSSSTTGARHGSRGTGQARRPRPSCRPKWTGFASGSSDSSLSTRRG